MSPVRNIGPAIFPVLLVILGTNAFAAPAVVRSSVVPESGVLVLLGGGLMGLAALIRRHISN
jgi:hypothetical protein